MSNDENSIKTQMDSDKGFQSKRKVLVTLSILFIGIKLSGIKIIEANTFILKLSIANEGAIGQLIFFALIYTFIRYFTYAHKYHVKLFNSWSQNLMADDFFIHLDSDGRQFYGLIPEKFPMNDGYYNFIKKDSNSITTRYECKGLFRRYLVYDWKKGDDYETDKASIHEYIKLKPNWLKWINNKIRKPGLLMPKVIRKELYYQFRSYIQDREQLDLLAPYLLAIFAICCQFYSSEIINFLGIT
ncbi:hypothetical protein GCM10011365_16830 [Marinicella pacifica]|uniref:Uncharacterized protein n=1 Tax=Marinicella pacifica TaxID=1171543 RepID=A0A917FPM1_9GAMM|nr:hypothetical protein [Marinicella pacifica]GGF96161.1 hypothetical protein GCM10011365_16830 [Marinicella pacifica]